MAPEWFIKAKQAGSSESELKQLIRASCDELNQLVSSELGDDATLTVDDAWVDSLFMLYSGAGTHAE